MTAAVIADNIVVHWDAPVSSLEKPQGAELEKTKESIWLSYDLGASGDYEGMYSWLDYHGAKECGSSVAFLKDYQFEGDLFKALEADLKNMVLLKQRSRIYVIFSKDNGVRGGYLFGKRKAPPWTGYGKEESEPEIDEV